MKGSAVQALVPAARRQALRLRARLPGQPHGGYLWTARGGWIPLVVEVLSGRGAILE